ncbi:MAG: PIG-L deacetylase family protein [Alphaproteobacteria bacterium]
MTRICIVSPHLDDALLSCGVMIQRRVAAGDKVFILNIFSEGTNAANRQQEDKAAAALLGAEPVFLNELDAPDRDPKYKPTENLFFAPLEPADRPFIDKVASRIDGFLQRQRIDLVFFPLAAGTHIDHRVAHAAGRILNSAAVLFYEDRPYILWPGVLHGRMNQIDADVTLPPVTREQMLASLNDYHYLKFFVPKGHYQEHCLPLYFKMLEDTSAKTLKANSETVLANEQELKTLFAALELYESQMLHIYPDYETFIKDSYRYERAMSGRDVYEERYWSLH